MKILNKDMSNGNVRIQIDVDDSYYFNIIGFIAEVYTQKEEKTIVTGVIIN